MQILMKNIYLIDCMEISILIHRNLPTFASHGAEFV
jgi:hypothetical protein